MAAIRGKDTKPELLIRKALHARGFRYRLHDKRLPGRPDLVFPKYKAVIQIHGCFWHGHGCHLFKWPATRKEFWEDKIGNTVVRDSGTKEKLEQLGWRVLTIWECAVKGKGRRSLFEITKMADRWLRHGDALFEIAARDKRA